jgi:phosphoglycolate phosphatase
MKHAKLLVFDLDGTLVDSLPDLHSALNRCFRDFSFPEVSLAQVRTAIGDGATILVQRLVPPECPTERLVEVVERFRLEYDAHACDETYLYPGVIEFLKALKERPEPARLAILTNKPEAPSRLIAAHFGLDALGIEWIVGGDSLPTRKPHPQGLRWLMEQAGVGALDTLMVGDGPADAGAAQAAGVPFAALACGYGDTLSVQGYPCESIHGSFADFAADWLEERCSVHG